MLVLAASDAPSLRWCIKRAACTGGRDVSRCLGHHHRTLDTRESRPPPPTLQLSVSPGATTQPRLAAHAAAQLQRR